MTPIVSAERLTREAEAGGYDVGTLEKVTRLLDLLDRIVSDRYLGSRFVLKGGTALNLFLFDLPRLSVDIDLNYIGSASVETMKEERQEAEHRFERIFKQSGLSIRTRPKSHAGGKWIMRYPSSLGGRDIIEVDLNYLQRVPLWQGERRSSFSIAGFKAANVPLLDEHELAAGKLVALLTRTATRDLFDAHHLLSKRNLDPEKLRLATVIYGAMSRTDWRQVTPDHIQLSDRDLRTNLLPVLRTAMRQEVTADPIWSERMREECKERLSVVLPLREHECEFITGIREEGVIRGELLTDDPDLISRIELNPGLRWRTIARSVPDTPDEME